jgi:hypothetical protein
LLRDDLDRITLEAHEQILEIERLFGVRGQASEGAGGSFRHHAGELDALYAGLAARKHDQRFQSVIDVRRRNGKKRPARILDEALALEVAHTIFEEAQRRQRQESGLARFGRLCCSMDPEKEYERADCPQLQATHVSCTDSAFLPGFPATREKRGRHSSTWVSRMVPWCHGESVAR